MLNKKIDKSRLIYALISIIAFFLMIYYSDEVGMWTDELSIIGTIELNNPNSEFILCQILKIFYNIMPYGQRYLFLPLELITALGIYTLGLIGEKIYSKRLGLFMCLVGGSSQYVYIQIGHEFRPYFMLFFTSIITYYLFICRNNMTKPKISTHLIYGLALLGIIDSHEYGKLLVCFYILADILLVVLKKNKKITLISDLFPVVYGVYWIFNTTVGSLVNSYQWTERPSPRLVWSTFNNLCGNSNLVLWCMFLGLGCIILTLFFTQKQIRSNIVEVMNYSLPIITFFGIFGASIFYSLFINPQNSLYIDRYFVSVILSVFYMAGIGLEFVYQLFLKLFSKQTQKYIVVVFCVIFLSLFVTEWRNIRMNPGIGDCTFREMADYLKTCDDIYNDDTLVVFSDWDEVILGWNYYFTEKGEKAKANCAAQMYLHGVDLSEYNTIYAVSQHISIDSDIQAYFESNYTLVYDDPAIKLQKYIKQ